MIYIGLDAHVKSSAICVLDSNGKQICNRQVRGYWPKVIEELKKVMEDFGGPMSICFEASCGSGHLHDQLKRIAKRVVVAHPGQLRLIFRSKKKNDRVDARKLATLLFLDQVPPVYVPGRYVRSWRQTIEYRMRLVNKRAQTKNQIRALMRSYGIEPHKKLWSKEGMGWLSRLEMPDELSSFRLSLLLDELVGLIGKVREVERVLAREAKRNPAVDVLMTIPGIGIRTAECLVAYIDDPHRFSGNKVGSYFGLVPSLDSSAGVIHLGHITKQGPPTARKLLTEAAWLSIRKSKKVRSRYERIMNGDPDRKKIAIIATAHYLLRVSHSLLMTGEVWDEAA